MYYRFDLPRASSEGREDEIKNYKDTAVSQPVQLNDIERQITPGHSLTSLNIVTFSICSVQLK